jgi:predicted ester cyclase
VSEKNKAFSRRIFDEAWAGELDVADEVLEEGYVMHGLGVELPPGPGGFKLFVSTYRTAFPDVQMTVEDQIAEGDMAVTRWTARGTHRGELMGIPATGNEIEVMGMAMGRAAGDKMVEGWTNWDGLGMLQQLGVIPPIGESSE